MSQFFYIILISLILLSCVSNQSVVRLSIFRDYNEALADKGETQWNYTADTLLLWFDNRDHEPSKRYRNAKRSKWSEWDQIMHSESYFDSIWYDTEQGTVKGYFYENNDFYKLIGRPANKTLKTYWFNKENKITEILIYSDPEENTTSDVYLKPVIGWAQQYHAEEISELYSNNEILPSTENAIRWNFLLKKYHQFKDSINSTY